MLIHSKELFMGGGGKKEETFVLPAFADTTGIVDPSWDTVYILFPRTEVGAILLSNPKMASGIGWNTALKINGITGTLGVSGSIVSIQNTWGCGAGMHNYSFKRIVEYSGYTFFEYTKNNRYVLVSPNAIIGDYVLEPNPNSGYSVTNVSSSPYHNLEISINNNMFFLWDQPDWNFEYIYRY